MPALLVSLFVSGVLVACDSADGGASGKSSAGESLAATVAGAGEERPQAVILVRAYFAAMAAQDCAAVTRLVDGKLAENIAKQGCKEAFHAFEEHGVKLLRVEKSRRDGRFGDTSLVTVVMRQDDKEKRIVVGVQRIGGQQRVTRL